MPNGLYFVVKCSSFTYTLHLAESDAHLKKKNQFSPSLSWFYNQVWLYYVKTVGQVSVKGSF